MDDPDASDTEVHLPVPRFGRAHANQLRTQAVEGRRVPEVDRVAFSPEYREGLSGLLDRSPLVPRGGDVANAPAMAAHADWAHRGSLPNTPGSGFLVDAAYGSAEVPSSFNGPQSHCPSLDEFAYFSSGMDREIPAEGFFPGTHRNTPFGSHMDGTLEATLSALHCAGGSSSSSARIPDPHHATTRTFLLAALQRVDELAQELNQLQWRCNTGLHQISGLQQSLQTLTLQAVQVVASNRGNVEAWQTPGLRSNSSGQELEFDSEGNAFEELENKMRDFEERITDLLRRVHNDHSSRILNLQEATYLLQNILGGELFPQDLPEAEEKRATRLSGSSDAEATAAEEADVGLAGSEAGSVAYGGGESPPPDQEEDTRTGVRGQGPGS